MKLGEVLERVPFAAEGAGCELKITSLAYDSRRVERGSVFFAIEGENADGHKFIPDAIRRGAVAVVSERESPAGISVSWIRVPAIRRALAEAARAFYGYPDKQLRLAGITGTNGKTTTAFLLNKIFLTAGVPAGLMGTIEYRMGGQTKPALNTTPESLDLASCFRALADSGGRAAVLEVSSHALAQERVWGLHFEAAVFTNLTRDHLDYHRDFEHYFAAKKRLFEGEGGGPPDLAVINADDAWGRRLAESKHSRQLTYGFTPGADVRVMEFWQAGSGLSAILNTPEGETKIESALLGRVNLMNIMAAVAAATGMGIPMASIQEGVRSLTAVPGRFEKIDEGQPFLVVIDYAHTDDALENVLQTAREFTANRLIVLFGCGGERDRTKRPIMGELAGRLGDFVVVTSDNPRSEDPILIMNDILVGLQKTGKPYAAEVDRKIAIRKALGDAREGDVVVLAGKGHETYQVLPEGTIPFDDREVAREVLHELGFRRDS